MLTRLGEKPQKKIFLKAPLTNSLSSSWLLCRQIVALLEVDDEVEAGELLASQVLHAVSHQHHGEDGEDGEDGEGDQECLQKNM